MLLFHGSPEYFEKIDLSKTKEYRDFGKAFYLAENYFDSLSLIRKNKSGFLYTFEYIEKTDLNILTFKEKDLNWSNFIYNCRTIKDFNNFDIVIGNTAGGDILKYLKNHKKKLDNPEEFLKVISDTTLGKQFAFLSNKSLSSLKLVNIEEYRKDDFS